MSPLVRFLALFSLLTSLSALAQNFQFKLEGSFSTEDSSEVNYTIHWNETSGAIQGIYQDNYYSPNPNAVTGAIDTEGRSFIMILPQLNKGIRSIRITTPQTGPASASIPTHILTEDSIGAPVDDVSTFALMTTVSPLVGMSSTPSCTVGFGSLTGYCGLYSGNIAETQDTANRCDLLSFGEPRLELTADTHFNLYFHYINTLDGIPEHSLGTFLFSPLTPTLSITNRNCGQLAGTSFSDSNCQTLSLFLNFLEYAGRKTFTGSYTITDETTQESCTFSINVSQLVSY